MLQTATINMTIEKILSEQTIIALKSLYGANIDKVAFEQTNADFEGDLTLVVFPFLKISKKNPQDIANEIGAFLKEHVNEIASFNVVKGFLNLSIDSLYWINYFKSLKGKEFIAKKPAENAQTVIVEYSSPNTNKPLHLGHIRNNLLGFSVAEILKAAGYNVIKANIVNDRGIHICKSMLAWQKWGNGETPETSGMKGDHLVGKYYVEFDKHYKGQIAELEKQGKTKEEAEKQAPLMLEAQEMLVKWEANDKAVRELWQMMNGWVYDGFAVTYKMLGVDFDKTYYESNTYLLGKSVTEKGLKDGIFQQRPDKSIFIDLTADGLDEKTLLRGDGTSVYITQDLGTAIQRHQEEHFNKMAYVVGNEQDYHFKVLFLILKKLGYEWASGLSHLSYGMVELPHGKMKSREGTVVDADDLMQEMINTAAEMTAELGKATDLTEKEATHLYRTVGLGALKYFMLKVDPKKKMLFNPAESIDFHGNTAPFIQYNYVRTQALLRKVDINWQSEFDASICKLHIQEKEKELIIKLFGFDAALKQAAQEYSPAIIANYVYDLAKDYSQYYHDPNTIILKEQNKDMLYFKLQLSHTVGAVIKTAMGLLGIEVPEKM